MLLAIFVIALNDAAFGDILRQHDTFVIIGKTCKNFVGTTIQQTDKCDPLFTVILEFHHISFQFTWTGRHDDRRFHTITVVFLFLAVISRQQYAGTGAVTINRTTFTATFPGFHIQCVNQFFRHIRRQVDRDTDGMVYPFLDTALHTYFLQPVYIV